MLPAFVLGLPPQQEYAAFLQHLPAANRLLAALCVPAFLFAPAFLWTFARECPRVHRRTWLDDLARRMIPASVLIGVGLWVACAVTLALARAGATAPVALVLDGTVATQDLLVLGAGALVALRAHTASADEVRRVVVFSAGFLLYMGVSAAYDVAEAFAPGDWVSNYRWLPTVLLMEVLRFPGLLLLWYAVLAARIPHLREAVRVIYRRLLLRRSLLGAVAAVPAGALAWLIGRSPERAVGAVIADPLAQALVAAVGMLLLVIAARERILLRLDAWILPETADQRQALADAAGALAQAERSTTVGETVTRTVRRGCGAAATLLVADDAETRAGGFSAPQARCVPLSRQTALVHLLETAGGPVRVEPAGRPSVFPLLPPDDAAWVTETGADVIVPVPGPGTDVLGVLVVGRRLDGRLVRSVDLPFLEALGAAAGLALARLQLLNAPGRGSGEAPAAEKCPVCRCVTAAGAPPGCACGSAYVATEVPTLLAGKFRLMHRLGTGGMGAVYLARDLRLERDVAIKILTARPLGRLRGPTPEAWAMSTVTHPAVAQIHGVESWRGRSCLVVEFLAGGTLEDRLRDGPLAPAEAVSVVTRLADALAALHEKGCLHGDVKPSNIGFTAEGSPKLLDFGLAHAVDDAALVGGTLAYLSPERGAHRPPGRGRRRCLVAVRGLYEMVAGRQPFAGGTLEEVQRRIRRQRLAAGGPDAAAAPTAATAVAAYGRQGRRPCPARVDETLAAPAPATCPDCGGAVEVTGAASQYQEDLPPVRPLVRRFDIEVGHCSQCRRRIQGRHALQTSDALGAARAQLGPGVVALVVELHTHGGMPLAKVADLLQTRFGLHVTPGGLAHLLHRAARDARPAYEELREQVRNAPVVTADETGWRVGAVGHWLWAAVTPTTTVYAICAGRGFDDAQTVLGADFDGVLVRDGWVVYRRYTTGVHQSCLQHLLRRCEHLQEDHPHSGWAGQVQDTLQAGLALRDRRNAGGLSDHGLATARGRLLARLSRLIDNPPPLDDAERFAAHLAIEFPAIFTFLWDPSVDATNWRAEQAIRPAVVIRKVCGGNRTRKGADTQQVLASVVRTARQRNLDLPALFATMLRAADPLVPDEFGLPPPPA